MPARSSEPLAGWRRGVLLLLRLFIAVGAFALSAGLIVSWMPQSVPFVMAVSGNSPLCSAGDVWQAGAVRAGMQELIEEIKAGSKIIETDAEGYELWETPVGRFWAPQHSESWMAVVLAQQEVDQYGAVYGGVQPGEVVLDGGAHVGLYARKAVAMGAKIVVAIEPAPVNVECLRRNLKDEIAAGKVIVYPKGIWDEEDELPLYEDPGNSAADSFLTHSSTAVARHTIALTRIDTVVEELGLERVDRIKMDIKGATLRALQGGEKTLGEFRPHIVLSTEEDADDPRALNGYLAGLGIGYQLGCGGYYLNGGSVEPDIVHFFVQR